MCVCVCMCVCMCVCVCTSVFIDLKKVSFPEGALTLQLSSACSDQEECDLGLYPASRATLSGDC